MAYGVRSTRHVDSGEIAEFRKNFSFDETAASRRAELTGLIATSRSTLSYDDLKEDYFALWVEMAIKASKLTAVDKLVNTIADLRARYAVIEAATNVPWHVVALIHALEASLDFQSHLHNGDPLSARTVQVPAGRPVNGRPPFTWEESAIDAIRYDKLDQVESWNIERLLYVLERFNGFGYRKHHPEVKTPYLWSFSNHYTKGKYVADGTWSSEAVSKQCGAAVLLKRLIEREIIDDIDFELELHLRHLSATRSGVETAELDDDSRFSEDLDGFGSITSQSGRGSAYKRAIPTARVGLGDAHWPANPANAPDTWHLPAAAAEAEFDLTANLVDEIISLGAFSPDTSTNGRLVLSLRGCMLADGSDLQVDQQTIRVKAVRPDHENFRCLIGAVDTASRLISLYIASTVPRRTGMLRFYNKINFGTTAVNCNMLPTGCYEHCVGTHGGHAGDVTFVLRLGDGPTSADAGPATVLRTVNDLVYGTADWWDNTAPGDNIHPAFLSTSFSSVGCLTLRGNQTPDGSYTTASGEWKKFRKKVGFEGTNYGKRFDNVLVTGHEAAAIALAIAAGSDTTSLACLRQGSRGETVHRLQSQLGIGADGNFGADTCQELVALQRNRLGFATGTCNSTMANLLGLTLS